MWATTYSRADKRHKCSVVGEKAWLDAGGKKPILSAAGKEVAYVPVPPGSRPAYYHSSGLKARLSPASVGSA